MMLQELHVTPFEVRISIIYAQPTAPHEVFVRDGYWIAFLSPKYFIRTR